MSQHPCRPGGPAVHCAISRQIDAGKLRMSYAALLRVRRRPPLDTAGLALLFFKAMHI
ncbi:hypothetical protein M378DRAFT_167274 [Amanita muscaria Koide BX008]|uniref:Uncharacterized protein n=1 Tax=Amanita muscaria (strain Koide BX008) TaxID=946122 RepID=A0A0C2SDM0_AMAMK|nr:hypothetical protein M378DRAFT_167274 [Amanita muscaria Koide BX008]